MGNMSSDCIFCKIIKGEAPADFVYRDEDLVVFRNIRPSAPVHVLVVPVEHIESINALEEKHSAIIAKMILKARVPEREPAESFTDNFLRKIKT